MGFKFTYRVTFVAAHLCSIFSAKYHSIYRSIYICPIDISKLTAPKKLRGYVSYDVYVPRIDDLPFYCICFTISWGTKNRETDHGS